ncbi:YihY/virulence factor BrkB family protein [Arthrobacter sp. HLT1-20]
MAAWSETKHAAFQTAGGNFVRRAAALFQWLNAWVGQFFPLRVWNLYTRRRGPLLAAGNAYLMFFSVGAMLVAGFAIFGMIASDNEVLRDAVITMVAESTPGLIDTGSGGLATPEQLLGTSGFGLTLVISLVALTVTALGWINGLREGIRSVLGLARDRTNPVLSKLRDGATLLVLAVALVLTSALGALSTAAVGNISEFLGWGTFLTGLSARLGSVFLMFVLDVAVAIVMFSLASRVRMPRRVLLLASVFSGAGATILRFFSAMLLGGITNNALLAPFAVILGLFVWFYLLSQVYLIAAAIAAVRAADLRPRTAT